MKKQKNDLPHIKTKRLLISALTEDMTQRYYRSPEQLGAELHIHLHEPARPSPDEIPPAIPSGTCGNNGLSSPLWLIARAADMTAVGECGFYDMDKASHTVCFYYIIYPEYKGESFAVETVGAMTSHAFAKSGIYYIKTAVQSDNERAIKTLSACGFAKLPSSDGASDGTSDSDDNNTGEEYNDRAEDQIKQLTYELEKPPTAWSATYMCIGMSLGMSLGLVFEQMTTGMCIGMALGMAVGAALDMSDKKSRRR